MFNRVIGDDKGRSTLRDFFHDIKNGEDPEELCDAANQIIKSLNCCTRNLIPGHRSANRSIGENKDLHLVKQKGHTNRYRETEPSKRISYFFEQLPTAQNYEPKTINTKNGKAVMSSSVNAEINKSYVCEDKATSSYYKKMIR